MWLREDERITWHGEQRNTRSSVWRSYTWNWKELLSGSSWGEWLRFVLREMSVLCHRISWRLWNNEMNTENSSGCTEDDVWTLKAETEMMMMNVGMGLHPGPDLQSAEVGLSHLFLYICLARASSVSLAVLARLAIIIIIIFLLLSGVFQTSFSLATFSSSSWRILRRSQNRWDL